MHPLVYTLLSYAILLLCQCTLNRHKYLYSSVLASWFFSVVKMSSYEPDKEHLRHVLLFLFNQKKNASESRQILVETYGDNVLTQDVGLTQVKHQHPPQNQIALERRECCASGGTRRVWCTMSF